jgi:hypothetical protein
MSVSSDQVNSQITDGVTQASTHVIGLGAALAAVNVYLGLTQAQTLLYANMVNQQQQQAMLSLAVTTRCIKRLHRSAPAAVADVQGRQASVYRRTVNKEYFHPGRPVVT